MANEADETPKGADLAGRLDGLVSLDEWKRGMLYEIECFADSWADNRQHSPAEFPATLPEAEWDERFRKFYQIHVEG